MKKKTILALIIFSAAFVMTLQETRSQEINSLPKKSRQWLERDVALVITPAERAVFLKLTSETQRERFIEEFWRQRDPDLETRNNEFRLAHYRRIAFADDKFGRKKGAEGWRTDRGRIYVLLGKPLEVESLAGQGIHPLEIWDYHARYFGLPSHFRLLFHRPPEESDYRLYSPLEDGPSALINEEELAGPSPARISAPAGSPETQGLKPQDIRAWEILKERLGPKAAETSLSFIPSLKGSAAREESKALLDSIFAFPASLIDNGYPARFLEGQAEQPVNSSLHSEGQNNLVRVLLDPIGLFYIHYAISPEHLSLILSRGNHLTNIKTSLLLTDSGGNTAYQGVRNRPVELTNGEVKRICDARFQLQDAFPAIPGRYTLNLIMENQAGREFLSMEQAITVPESGFPWMSSPVLSNKVERVANSNDGRVAFLVGDTRIYPATDHIFKPEKPLFVFLQLRGVESDLADEAILEISLLEGDRSLQTSRKSLKEYSDLGAIVEAFEMTPLPQGEYSLDARLVNGSGTVLLQRREAFSIAGKDRDVWALSLDVPQPSDPRLAFMVGMQYLNRNERDMAYQYLSQAHKGNKGSFEYAMAFARVLSTRDEWPSMIETLEPFAGAGRRNFELSVYLGRAYQNTDQYDRAITQYLRAISYRGYITNVLNDLGQCYVEVGNTDRAIWAWEKSLELRPGQEDLKKKLEELKK
jgi:GWxTD domain-containing protein